MNSNLIRHYIRGNAGVLLVTWVLFNSTSALSYVYIPTYIKMTGGNAYDVGLTYALGTLALALTLPLGGYLTDKLGRRFVIILCTWAIAILTFPFIYAPTWVFIAIYYVLNMLFSFHQPALMAVLADSLPKDRVVGGFLFTSIIPTLPMIILMPVGGFIISIYGLMGFKLAFLISGFIAIAASAIRMRYLRETIHITNPLLGTTTLLEAYKSPFVILRGVGEKLKLSLIITLLLSIASAPLMSLAQVYGIYVIKLSTTQWGLLMSTSLVFTVALAFYVSLMQKINEAKLMIYLILVSIAVNAIALIPSVQTFIAYAITYQMTTTLMLTALQGIITQGAAQEIRGRISSTYAILQLLGQSLGNYTLATLYTINKDLLFIIPLTILTITTAPLKKTQHTT